MAVYVPTNHLYLGDVAFFPRASVFFPDITVQEGIRIFLTGGTSLPERVSGKGGDDAVGGMLLPGQVRSRADERV